MRTWVARAVIALAAPVLVFALIEAGLFVLGTPVRAEQPAYLEQRFMQRCRMPVEQLRETCTRAPTEADRSATRVFIYGGSSVAPGGRGERSFPTQMREKLDRDFPGRFQIRNFGSPCKDSIYVSRCVSLSLAGQPDIVVIYSGHNDFANFVTARPRVQILLERQPWIGDLDHLLSHTRFYSLLTRFGESAGLRESGREQRLDPARYDDAIAVALAEYTRNLESILEETAAAGVPVVLVTVVSNLYDFPAPLSEWKPTNYPDPAHLDDWGQFYDAGARAFEDGRHLEALSAFKRARDHRLNGRAPTRLNERLRELAAANFHVHLVDFENQLDRVGLVDGIGCRFFGAPKGCDQFHPNTRTHRMIAAAVIKVLLSLDAEPR